MSNLKIDDTDSRIVYSVPEHWKSCTDASLAGSAFNSTTTATSVESANATLVFEGVNVAVFGLNGHENAMHTGLSTASYFIDGIEMSTSGTTNSISAQEKGRLFASGMLPDGTHTLVVSHIQGHLHLDYFEIGLSNGIVSPSFTVSTPSSYSSQLLPSCSSHPERASGLSHSMTHYFFLSNDIPLANGNLPSNTPHRHVSSTSPIVVGVLCGPVLICVLIIIVVVFWRRHLSKARIRNRNQRAAMRAQTKAGRAKAQNALDVEGGEGNPWIMSETDITEVGIGSKNGWSPANSPYISPKEAALESVNSIVPTDMITGQPVHVRHSTTNARSYFLSQTHGGSDAHSLQPRLQKGRGYSARRALSRLLTSNSDDVSINIDAAPSRMRASTDTNRHSFMGSMHDSVCGTLGDSGGVSPISFASAASNNLPPNKASKDTLSAPSNGRSPTASSVKSSLA